MEEDTKKLTNDEIRKLLLAAPVWDGELWENLQAGDYDKAEERFALILKEELSEEEWPFVHWEGIFSGIESFRGEIDILTWGTLALPALCRAILKIASPKNLEDIFISLSLERARSSLSILIASIPEKDFLKKKVWLQEENPNLFSFFNTNLAGFSLEMKNCSLLSRQGFSRAQILPESLRPIIFSSTAAQSIDHIGKNHKFDEEKLRAVAAATGEVVLGLIKFDDFYKNIFQKENISEDEAKIIAAEIEEEILKPYKEEIVSSYPPTPSVQPQTPPMIKFPIGEGSTTLAQESPSNSKSTYPISSTQNIPQPLTQKTTQPFFRKWSSADEKKDSQTAEINMAPIIIHQETKAQSLPTTPKLGFRIGGDKIDSTTEKPAPLQASELSALKLPVIKKDTDKKEISSIGQIGAKLSIGQTPDSNTTPSSRLIDKIKGAFSQSAEKLITPEPPQPPPAQTTQSLSEKKEELPLRPQSISIANTNQKETAEIKSNISETIKISQPPPIVLPTEKIISAQELVKPKPHILPSPQAETSKVKTKDIIIETEKEIIVAPAPKVDLQKIPTGPLQEIPAPKNNSGIFSRLFKKAEEKTTFPPAQEKIADQPKMIQKETTLENLTVPPLPPSPPKTADLPKATLSKTSISIPTKKISPLSTKPNIVSDPKLQTIKEARTVDVISPSPRVINYSEYPSREESK